MDREHELLTKAKTAIMAVYSAFGRPGEYGYGSAEGKALAALYDLNNEIADELKLLEEIYAALAEPATAEEEASVEASWQRFKSSLPVARVVDDNQPGNAAVIEVLTDPPTLAVGTLLYAKADTA